MDLSSFLFYIIATFTGLSAVGVLVAQNIVRSAVSLLFTLAGTAGIFFLLGADFVGATQLIIYVGGILVLVVFGVMLTAQGPFINMRVGAAEWGIAAVVAVLLFGVLAFSTSNLRLIEGSEQRMNDAQTSMSSAELGMAFLGIREITPKGDLTSIRDPMRPAVRTRVAYLLPFEIVSVHLLVVLIGAAYLARAKRRRGTVS